MQKQELFKEQGYLLLEQFFDKNKVNNILLEAKKVFYRQFVRLGLVSQPFETLSIKAFDEAMYAFFEKDLKSFSHVGKQVQHLISLHQLSLEQQVVELLKEVGLITPVISTRPVLFFNHRNLAKEKVYYLVDAHQDWRSMQGSLNSVVIWLPLMDITKEHGALQILPQSHKWGLRTNHIQNNFGMVKLSEKEEQSLIDVEVKQGDALVFSAFLVHKSGDNTSPTPRWSCHFRYNDLDEKTFINRGYPHPYVYYPQNDLITSDFPSSEQIEELFKTIS